MVSVAEPIAHRLTCAVTAAATLPIDLTLHALPLAQPAPRARTLIDTWLRATLAATTGETPAVLRFEESEFGKPYLIDAAGLPRAPAFNLSHSGSLAVLALSAIGRPIGVDIEIPKPGRDLLLLVDGFLSPAEQALLHDLPSADVQAWLLRRWSAKEAVAKAWGLGLSAGLRRIEIADGQPPTWRALDGLHPPDGKWLLAELEVPGGVGWLAWDDGEPT